VELGGSKSVVFRGGSPYKAFMCFDNLPYHGDVKNPSMKRFSVRAWFISGFVRGRHLGAGKTLAAHSRRL